MTANFQPTLSFRSERLIFRGINADTDKPSEEAAQNDYKLQHLAAPPPTFVQEGGSRLARLGRNLFTFVSVADATAEENSKEPGQAIGYCCLNSQPPRMAHYRSVEMGIMLYSPYQGKGYGSEALCWLLDQAFFGYGLHRVSLGTWEYNEAAIKMYEKVGFTHEGRTRKAVYSCLKWYDIINMGILEEEWIAIRSKQTQAVAA